MKNLLGPAVVAATIALIMPVAAQQGAMVTKPATAGGMMAAPAAGGMMAHTDAMASGGMKKPAKKTAGAMGSTAMSGGMTSGGMAPGAMKKDPPATH